MNDATGTQDLDLDAIGTRVDLEATVDMDQSTLINARTRFLRQVRFFFLQHSFPTSFHVY